MNKIKINATDSADLVTVGNGIFNVTIPIKITRRSHLWLTLLKSGKARNLAEVAEMEGMDRAYVSRMLNLPTMAPDIVASILDKSLPDHVTLFDLASGTPLLCDEQRRVIVKTS